MLLNVLLAATVCLVCKVSEAASKEVEVTIPDYAAATLLTPLEITALPGDTVKISFGGNGRKLEELGPEGDCNGARTQLSANSPYTTEPLGLDDSLYVTLDTHGWFGWYKPCQDGYKAHIVVVGSPTASPTEMPENTTPIDPGKAGQAKEDGKIALASAAVISASAGLLAVGFAFRKYRNGKPLFKHNSMGGDSIDAGAFTAPDAKGRTSEMVTSGAEARKVLDKGRNPSRYSALMVAKVYQLTGRSKGGNAKPTTLNSAASEWWEREGVELPEKVRKPAESFAASISSAEERELAKFLELHDPSSSLAPHDRANKLVARYTKANLGRALNALYGDVPGFFKYEI